MARMNSRNRREYDADSNAILKAVGAAETASANQTGIPLNRLSAAYWDNGEQPNGVFVANVALTAYDNTTGDEEMTLTFQACTDAAGTGATEVARLVIPTGAAAVQTALGFYEVAIATQLIERLLPTATHLRVISTIAGTTPSFTWHSWVTFLAV